MKRALWLEAQGILLLVQQGPLHWVAWWSERPTTPQLRLPFTTHPRRRGQFPCYFTVINLSARLLLQKCLFGKGCGSLDDSVVNGEPRVGLKVACRYILQKHTNNIWMQRLLKRNKNVGLRMDCLCICASPSLSYLQMDLLGFPLKDSRCLRVPRYHTYVQGWDHWRGKQEANL